MFKMKLIRCNTPSNYSTCCNFTAHFAGNFTTIINSAYSLQRSLLVNTSQDITSGCSQVAMAAASKWEIIIFSYMSIFQLGAF